MKSALLTKAALCICPPAIVAGSVASVPPVRRAVHHFTAAYEPHRAKPAAALAPCAPGLRREAVTDQLPPFVQAPVGVNDQAVAMNAVVPGAGLDSFGPQLLNPVPLATAGPGYVGDRSQPNAATAPGTDGGTPAPGVPEPSVWFTMTVGFGVIGSAIRQRRRRLVRAQMLAATSGYAETLTGNHAGGIVSAAGTAIAGLGAALWAGVGPLQANTKLAQIGGKALHSALLAKAAMCVCPTVALAIGAATVPPVRHAIYKATVSAVPAVPSQKPKLTATSAPATDEPCLPAAPAIADAAPITQQLAVLEPPISWPG